MGKMVNNIKEVRKSIIAIGFKPNQNQITIIGSGFSVSEGGKILTAAHLYNQVPDEFKDKILGMFMTKQDENGLEHYKWGEIKLLKKDESTDSALFEYSDYKNTLMSPLELEDSNNIEVGSEVYFIGFPYGGQLINDGFGITLIANRGIISNVKRDGIIPKHPMNWFIVDAISNPGNSGCPLISVDSNKVVGVMTISFRTKSLTDPELDIREPMHIAGAKPINLSKNLL